MATGDYISYIFDTQNELFLAFLSLYPFESFEETNYGTIAYISEFKNTTGVQKEVEDLCTKYSVKYEIKVIEPQNWNAKWEASFQPVEINKFCRIRADFHPSVAGYKHDIIVNPKMAFGTGHHETTWMMIDAMSYIKFENKTVFDYGCGTGVLAILAEKLGSKKIDALDIEVESYENTKENAAINKCGYITPLKGELNEVNGKSFDVVLANINRHVLLKNVTSLFEMLNEDGVLLLSGILGEDIELVTKTYKTVGFTILEVRKRGNWRCIKLTK